MELFTDECVELNLMRLKNVLSKLDKNKRNHRFEPRVHHSSDYVIIHVSNKLLNERNISFDIFLFRFGSTSK